MRTTAAILTDSVGVVARVECSTDVMSALSDRELVAASGAVAEARQHLDSYGALIAAEIGRRSRRELGHAGLAQREGYRTPEAFVQHVTGSTKAEARALVNVGTMMAEASAAQMLDAAAPSATSASVEDAAGTGAPPMPVPDPWCSGIAQAVGDNRITLAQADAIRGGLGESSESVPAELLADRATHLLKCASNPIMPMAPEELRRLGRQLRDSLDSEGLAARHTAQQEAQYLRAWKRADGMVAGSLLLDKENGAYLLSVLDEITSPRRGGPRFMADADRARERRFAEDPRSTERIAAESVIELLRQGSAVDQGKVLGTRKPSVRVVVTQEALTDPAVPGARGVIERTGESVPIGTVERLVCDAGTVNVAFDSFGRPLDVGRDQRLFTERQRIALAIRDGGCMWPDCDHPPSWTEAHHTEHWAEHHGKTNTADGILLCRYHHLLLHNRGWRIMRHGTEYFLRPPPDVDPDQTPLLLESKSPIMRGRSTMRAVG